MDDKLKILIVDDHELVRKGLKLLLKGNSKYTVVGESENGKLALEFLNENSADIVLMDINMPVMGGIECTKEIKSMHPSTNVLALTMQIEEQHIKEMMLAGASGYLLKDSSMEELEDALDVISIGKNYYSQEVSQIIMEDVLRPKVKKDIHQELTRREVEVLRLIVQEKSNYEIADELFISIRTVDAHRRNLLEKTGAKNAVGLTKYAYKHNLLDQ